MSNSPSQLTQSRRWFKANWMSLIQVVAVVGGLVFAGMQLRASNNIASATFVAEFNNQLRNSTPGYSKIISALASGQSLTSFSDEQLDNYLVMWNLLGQFVASGRIGYNMAFDAFSYDVETTYCSPDIKKFVLETNSGPGITADYGDFTNLARRFLRQDRSRPCSPNAIYSRDQ